MRKVISFILLSFVLAGCFSGVTEKKQISGHYYLFALYNLEDLNLSWSDDESGYIPLLEKTVYAAGYDDNYIIAKQHPNDNRSIVNYCILLLYKGKEPVKNWTRVEQIYGPFTLQEFEQKRKELGIKKLCFSIVYKELE